MEFSNLTKDELNVVKKSLFEYQARADKQKTNEEIMNKKKFSYGDAVVKNKASLADQLFGDINTSDIGIIVGHYDCDGLSSSDRDMYRVHFSENSPYIGTDVSTISSYKGKVPEHLSRVKWNQITELRVIL